MYESPPDARPAYVPYGGVLDMWRSKERQVLVYAGAGTGKTRGVLEKLHLTCLKYPGCRVLLTRATRASMTESVLVTFESHVAGVHEIPNLRGMQRKTRGSYEYLNGSVMIVTGLDNPDRILSTEYDRIAVFEATECRENDIETLLPRLRNARTAYHQLICDCNPTTPSHWLKRRVDSGRMRGFHSTHKDNPRLWDGNDWTKEGQEYLSALGELTGHRRARFLEGRWAAAEGLVYSAFSEDVHVVSELPPGSKDWPRVRSIDFGYTNPFVCLWAAVDPDGRLWVYRELYKTQATIPDLARDINRLSEGESYLWTVSDHDAGERALLDKAGIVTKPARKAVGLGIQAVEQRFRVQGDGKPRLYLCRGMSVEVDQRLYAVKKPTGLIQELDSYVYPPGKDGKAEKEEPVKEHDHAADALRYMVVELDGLSGGGNGGWAGGNVSTNESKVEDRSMAGVSFGAGAW